jgi:predicted nuclease of restriction endonuclease-like (RecB) superfamily
MGYVTFLADLKNRVTGARIAAARAVNRELILLYWDIGAAIVEKQRTAKWGDAVVEQLAADLRRAFPEMNGFTNRNIWRMMQLYNVFTAPAILPQLVAELRNFPLEPIKSVVYGEQGSPLRLAREVSAFVPWGHYSNVLLNMEDGRAFIYYLLSTIRFGWTRNVLLNQVKAKAYERSLLEKKTHNFPKALPAPLAEQAAEMLKSEYNLEFLGLSKIARERQLENKLVSRLRKFLLELGYGFCFMGQQHRLVLGEREYFVDLLFYHRFLRALVAFDLKIGGFEPEHSGKMDFYLNLLNEKERAPGDNPSIGIILCAKKDDIEVEFALKTKANPIGVAEYHLSPRLPDDLRGKLPSGEQLGDEIRRIMNEQ